MKNPCQRIGFHAAHYTPDWQYCPGISVDHLRLAGAPPMSRLRSVIRVAVMPVVGDGVFSRLVNYRIREDARMILRDVGVVAVYHS